MDNEAKSSISWQSALDYIQEQNLSGALEILLEMVGYDPDNIALINLLSDCYYYLGEFDRAIKIILGIHSPDKMSFGKQANHYLPINYWGTINFILQEDTRRFIKSSV
jgi:lipopolysaccharide biosynthesis regulator YciM